jgi:hypothetical protein
VALAALAVGCSRWLAFWAGRDARSAVYERFTAGEAARLEWWFTGRVCDLCALGEVRDGDRSLVVVDAPRSRPSWSNGPVPLGGSPPLPVAGFDVWLSADADEAWHRLIAAGDPRVRSQRARRWLHQVLEAAHTCVMAEVEHRSARLDAALAQALAEAHDRLSRRLDRQLADYHAARAGPATGDGLATTLAEEYATVRDWIRRIDAVVIRVRRAVLSEDAEAAEAAEELRPPANLRSSTAPDATAPAMCGPFRGEWVVLAAKTQYVGSHPNAARRAPGQDQVRARQEGRTPGRGTGHSRRRGPACLVHSWPCSCRKPRPRRSGGVLVLVEDAAEAVASSYVEAGHLARVDDRCGQRRQRACVRDPLVWAVSVVELLELMEGVEQVPLVPDQRPVQ